jgi:hypothetical protein
MRLWTLCICFVYATIGYFLYGWGAQHELHWITIAIGICCVIAHQVSVCSVATAYAMDSFPGVSSRHQRSILSLLTMPRYPVSSSWCSRSAPRASISPSLIRSSHSSMLRVMAGHSRSLGCGKYTTITKVAKCTDVDPPQCPREHGWRRYHDHLRQDLASALRRSLLYFSKRTWRGRIRAMARYGVHRGDICPRIRAQTGLLVRAARAHRQRWCHLDGKLFDAALKIA